MIDRFAKEKKKGEERFFRKAGLCALRRLSVSSVHSVPLQPVLWKCPFAYRLRREEEKQNRTNRTCLTSPIRPTKTTALRRYGFAPFSSALFRRVAPLSARRGRAEVTPLLDSSAVLLRNQLKDFDGKSLNWGEGEAEAAAAVPVRRTVVVATRRPTVVREVAPTAAAQYAVRAR